MPPPRGNCMGDGAPWGLVSMRENCQHQKHGAGGQPLTTAHAHAASNTHLHSPRGSVGRRCWLLHGTCSCNHTGASPRRSPGSSHSLGELGPRVGFHGQTVKLVLHAVTDFDGQLCHRRSHHRGEVVLLAVLACRKQQLHSGGADALLAALQVTHGERQDGVPAHHHAMQHAWVSHGVGQGCGVVCVCVCVCVCVLKANSYTSVTYNGKPGPLAAVARSGLRPTLCTSWDNRRRRASPRGPGTTGLAAATCGSKQ